MKHILLFALAMLGVGISKAQPGLIPNGSFEQWHNVGGWYDEPDFWTTNNTPTFSGVVKDSNHSDGLYSMQVRHGGVAISEKIDIRGYSGIKFYHWVNMAFPDTDKVVLQTLYFLNGQIIDTQKFTIAMLIPLWIRGGFYTKKPADSMMIIITGGHDSGTIISVDKIEFLKLKVEDISALTNAQLSPNPFHKSATFRFNNPKHTSYRWILNDAIGRVVMLHEHVTGESIPIERNGLSVGIYLWQLWSEKEGNRASGKLIIE